MIRLPGHVVNAPAPFADAPLPDALAGLDLPAAADRVTALGGDRGLFAGALAASLTVDAAPDAARALDLVALAAWRAGAAALRDDALRRLPAVPADVAAAVLGLSADDVASFAEHQTVDPLWWPQAGAGWMLSVGGFSGLGGAWIRPPEQGIALDEPGAFAFLVAGRWWRLDCDVFCSALQPIDDQPVAAAHAAAQPVLRDDTHLAWILRTGGAG